MTDFELKRIEQQYIEKEDDVRTFIARRLKKQLIPKVLTGIFLFILVATLIVKIFFPGILDKISMKNKKIAE